MAENENGEVRPGEPDQTLKSRISEFARMAQWLVAALALYGLAATVVTAPQIQTALWKLGHITLGGWVGYWISRTLERQRVHLVEDTRERSDLRRSRAIIVAAAMIAMAFGL